MERPRLTLSEGASPHSRSKTPCAVEESASGGGYPLNITQPAINVFLASKQDEIGQINGLTYWQVANGYTAVALHDTWSNTTSNADVLDTLISTVEANQADCINEMNDDSMWWSICLLEMYELTQNAQHLNVAEAIWNHVQQYVVSPGRYNINGLDMAGAVMWTNKTNETQVNAITAGLFSELSARLACQAEPGPTREALLEYAEYTLGWILRCRYVPDENLVLDHIDLATGQTFDWSFTYNTGQAIGASIAIYNAMKSNGTDQGQMQTYMNLASNMALNAMNRTTWIDGDGTLTERDAYPGTGADPTPASQDCDAIGFKAILLRNLAKLYMLLRNEGLNTGLQGQIITFVQWQFHSLLTRNCNGQDQYGPWWAGPMDLPTSHSQLAALDVMAAIHAVGTQGQEYDQ
ncbi:glycoside hydrolase [Exophiala viscosa]|uniref:glycoside hydrolase n=1 Tax=Exophiala viscosa TaxID=2486360 RepID=UPI0021935378|nr:glycoside hydrolase [Exophiala viscosa]